MNENTILANLRTALVGNSALNAWSTTNYSQLPWFYIGMDPDDPPPAGHYPLVALFPDSRLTGNVRDDEETGVMLMVGVSDTTRTVDAVNSHLITYAGVTRCVELRRLVLAAVKAADLDGGMITSGEAEYETLLEFPLFIIMQLLTIRRPYEFRDERLV